MTTKVGAALGAATNARRGRTRDAGARSMDVLIVLGSSSYHDVCIFRKLVFAFATPIVAGKYFLFGFFDKIKRKKRKCSISVTVASFWGHYVAIM